jgi:hypothetical protein
MYNLKCFVSKYSNFDKKKKFLNIKIEYIFSFKIIYLKLINPIIFFLHIKFSA